jgi:hypothetical protein
LEIVIDKLDSRNMVCDWLDFYDCAFKKNWPIDRTILKLENAIGDVYGPDYRTEWKRRMMFCVNEYHKNASKAD